MPGSPLTKTTWPWLSSLVCCQARCKRPISSSRPTRGKSAVVVSNSASSSSRKPATRQTWTGSAMPLSACAPRPSQAKMSPRRSRVAALIRMASGAGEGLQAGGEVGRVADDGLLVRGTFADRLADDDESARDTNARGEAGPVAVRDPGAERPQRVEDREARADGARRPSPGRSGPPKK